jgi:hypothetical protein
MSGSIDRRDFLLLRPRRGQRSIDLSGEWLLMKFLDAELEGSTVDFFARLDHDLRQLEEVRLIDASWLTRDDLVERLGQVLDAFRARGGRVISPSPPSP